MDIKKYIDEIQDFPKSGISFKEISPLLSDAVAFNQVITKMWDLVETPDYWVGIDSRGFIFATALNSMTVNMCGLKLIRKKGKLPPPIISEEYELEYGTDTLEMKQGKGSVVIVDDVYATGGTMEAVEELCKRAGYTVIDKLCFIDLQYLHEGVKCKSLVQYE